MYGNSSKREQFLSRTGSHSTRFRRSGDNSDLKGNALDVSYTADIATNSAVAVEALNEEIRQRQDAYNALTAEAARIKERLLETLPFHVYSPLKKEQLRLGREVQELAKEIRNLKQQRKVIAENGHVRITTFSDTFVGMAQMTLPPEVFEEIRQATLAAMKKAGKHDQ